jgi:hypothetical protein
MTLIVVEATIVLGLWNGYLRTRMRISYQAEARLFVKAGLLRTICLNERFHVFFHFYRSLMIGICVYGVLPFATSFAQQVPDAAFKANVEQPAYTDKHPIVLFDGTSLDAWNHPTGANHHMFWETLTHGEIGAIGLIGIRHE